MRLCSAVLAIAVGLAAPAGAQEFTETRPPAWVQDVTRMAFGTPGEVDRIADAGAQVLHTNLVWPYYPLRKDGGGLSADERNKLRALVESAHKRGLKVVLGLPPFMPVALVKQHPDWRILPSPGTTLKPPTDKDLGTRSGCNNGPWGDYLIDVCAELIEDFGLDGFSFDGNYHPPLCHCPACQASYQQTGKKLPPRADLKDVRYRLYLVWRGERLEEHYRKLVGRMHKANANAALMTWTVNAGRYGHFLHSPRAMPTRLNRLIDLPMQEWWLDETNLGASVAPAFGAAYLRTVAGPHRPCASEPYLMSRGNPYGTDSFPAHERLTRSLLTLTHGNVAAHSVGWPGHGPATKAVFREVERRAPWLTHTESLPWAALLVSEQTRQFYAYEDIAGRFLPHVFGAFRAALEEHLPLVLVNDWDLHAGELDKYRVVVLANAAALSDAQVDAVRRYVRAGGGLVVTGETSLFDELGRPRHDFALTDVIGVSYKGRPKAPEKRPELDANFAITADAAYWKQRVGVARLSWSDHALVRDERLEALVPTKAVTFRGPLVWVSEPRQPDTVAWRMMPEGWDKTPLPGAICQQVGKGKVVYLATALDAGLWSYAYPYQRRLLARAMEWAAAAPPRLAVTAPMCVHATYWTRPDRDGRQVIVHLFNAVNTAAGHGLPATEVPLREETIPIAGIRVRFRAMPKAVHVQPEGRKLPLHRDGPAWFVEVPPLERHGMVVAVY
jgi:hypothetical protein